MTEGKSRAEIATFDALIAAPEDKEKMLAKQNQLAQQELQRRLGMGPPPSGPRRQPKAGNGYPH